MHSTRPLAELALAVGGELLSGDPSLPIRGVNVLADASSGDITFYGNTKYRKALDETRASAILINGEPPTRRNDVAWIRVANPHLAFARLSAVFYPRQRFAPGVHPQAFVHPEAKVHPEATVMAGATVEKGADIGARTAVFPGAYIGEHARVGEDSLLYPNVVVRERCLIGNRVILNAGCVIGADGFGFALDMEVPEHFKIPQAGIVRIEDDVEIGACSCVDRATLGETLIGRGTKIDNLVQIAHNVRVGPMTLVCAQVGVSGSTEIGSGVVLAGQVGVVGHIRVGDMAKVGAQSGIYADVPDGATVSGYPAQEHFQWLRSMAAVKNLGPMVKELRELQKRVEQLEAEKKERT